MSKAAKITVGMKNAMDKLPGSGRKCSGCGLKVPSYQGRYPKNCPECDTALSFGESKAIDILLKLGMTEGIGSVAVDLDLEDPKYKGDDNYAAVTVEVKYEKVPERKKTMHNPYAAPDISITKIKLVNDFEFQGKQYRKGPDFPSKLEKFVFGYDGKGFTEWIAGVVKGQLS